MGALPPLLGSLLLRLQLSRQGQRLLPSLSCWHAAPGSRTDLCQVLNPQGLGPGVRGFRSGPRSGLFGIQGLQQPQDFLRMAQDTRVRCDDLLVRVAESAPNASVVQLMDDLSDELCRTYDAAECCRNVHSDPSWVRAASQACTVLGEYISEVNHNTALYNKLHAAIQRYRQYQRQHEVHQSGSMHFQTPESQQYRPATAVQEQQYAPLTPAEVQQYDPETVLVGSKLLMDMEKSGIHLEPGPRQRMQRLMNQNQHYGMSFNAALADPKQLGSVVLNKPGTFRTASGAATAASSGFFASLTSRQVTVPLDTPTINHLLLTEPDEDTRKAVFMAGAAGPQSNLLLLDEILTTRREMAETLGCASYSDYKAVDASLAQESGAIVGFLEQVATSIRAAADAEVEVLRRLKGGRSPVAAWDVEHLMSRARTECAASSLGPQLSEYLFLGSVLEGFTTLMERVFGLQFQVSPAPADEMWAPNILKMTATHPEHGPMGVIYLDLCSRPGKYPGAVTFPIRCGRSLGPASYQLPVMALLADFGGGHPDHITLSYRELRTLLHELGHCCHNLASRTKYQHLWGTRCAQDMVEVPSHLWEHFAVDPAALRLLARHRSAGREPLPEEAGEKLVRARRMFSALELQGQVLLALVDQLYHGSAAAASAAAAEAGGRSDSPETSRIWQHVAQRYSSVPLPDGTHPQARVSHLTVYGGSYYSYVYARLLSGAVWNRHLEKVPLLAGGGGGGDGAAPGGRAVWDGLLRPGGAVEPLELVQGLLGPQALQQWPSGGWAPRPDGPTISRALMSF